MICTGGSYVSPWRDGGESDNLSSYEDRLAEIKKTRATIAKAKSVLVIGGGATGVESAGYMAEKFGDKKKIGIC